VGDFPDLVAEVWQRATSPQPVPDTGVLLALGLLAVALVGSPAGYRLVRHVVTLVHEAGHALVAVLVGRRLSGIRLHADTSGLTLSRGRPRGPGMVATLLAGYPAPALAALGSAWLLSAGYAAGVLWLLVLACTLMLLLVRNLYGLWVVLVTGGLVTVASWWLPPTVLSGLAHVLVLALLLAAPRSVLELARERRRRGSTGSDVDQLAALTPLPGAVWLGLFWLVTVVCLVAGVALLLDAS
jgi:Peptidase M50B-like